MGAARLRQWSWDWLSVDETKNFIDFIFIDFIKFLQDSYDHEIEDVVLLGDIFDNWIFPHDLTPPTLEELFTAEKNLPFVSELNAMARKCKVFYVSGNHDMHATRVIINQFFPEFIYCPKRFSSGLLITEHGHLYAMFNAPAEYSDHIFRLPLGYFISRIEATRKAMTNRESRTYRTYVDDRIYANAAFWCGSKCTFVETEKTENGYDVCIVRWLGNNEIERGATASI